MPLKRRPAVSVEEVVSYANLAAFPTTGETSIIYVAEDTNLTYRWTGSAYVEISAGVVLGETSATAYRGDRGKTGYDHSQLASGNPHAVTKAEVGLTNVDNTADANKPVSTLTQTALDAKADDNSYKYFEDFDQKILDETNRWTKTETAGTITLNNGTTGALGICKLAATGSGGVQLVLPSSGGAEFNYEDMKPTLIFRFAQTTGGNYENYDVGVSEDGNPVDTTNAGISLNTTGGDSSMYLKTSNGTVEKTTGISVSQWNSATTYKILKIVWESATSVKLYFDDVLQATHTTNNPAGTDKLIPFIKVSGSDEIMYLDYFKMLGSADR